MAGSIHENLFPLWQLDGTDQVAYLTSDPISDPAIQWLRWVVAGHQDGWNSWVRNGHDIFTSKTWTRLKYVFYCVEYLGFTCPYDFFDHAWEVKVENGTWLHDWNMTVTCTSY